MKERIGQTIAEYDKQGIHRTGSDVDVASAEWLSEEIRTAGATPLRESFEFQRVEIQTATLEFADLTIEGVPAYDCSYTDQEGVTGTLGELNSDASIGVIMAPPSDQSDQQHAIIEARRTNAHDAIIVVADEGFPSSGPTPVNAEHFRAPMGPPVLQVANRHWSRIQTAMSAGEKASVTAHATYTRAPAINVGTEIWGRDTSLAPLVVMTPRSGWWNCASERGGGIALWLELIRHFSDHQPKRSMIFTANTGHELSHTGLDFFIEQNPELPTDAHCWIHLGANFVARGAQILVQYSDKTIETITKSAMDSSNFQADLMIPGTRRPLGEARNIYDHQGRYLSLLASNPLFHHPEDRWPVAVDMKAAVSAAKFMLQAAEQLTES